MNTHRLLYLGSIIAFLAMAFCLRVAYFLNGDMYFLIDNGRDMLLVENIVDQRDLTLIGARSGVGGVFHGPGWLYMIVPFYLVANGNPFWTLVPLYLILSMVTIVSIGYVMYRLYGKNAGLLGLALSALAASLRDTVLYTTNAQVAPLVLAWWWYGVIKLWRGEKFGLFIMSIANGIGIGFEAALFGPLLSITVGIVLMRKGIISTRMIVAALFCFIVTVSNYIAFDLRHNFLMTKSISTLLRGNTEQPKGYEHYADLSFRITDRLYLMMSQFENLVNGYKIFSWILIFSVILIIYWQVVRKTHLPQVDELWLAFLIIILTYAMYILYAQPLWSHYTLGLSSIVIICFTLSYRLVFSSRLRSATLILCLLIVGIEQSASVIVTGALQAKKTEGSLSAQTEVVSDIYKQNILPSPHYFIYDLQILSYNIEYLMHYHAKKNNLSRPQQQKSSQTFLVLMPPPSGDQLAHQFWKTNVLHTNAEPKMVKIYESKIQLQMVDLSEDTQPPDPNLYHGLNFR